jgi:hypothetical protein
LHVVLDLPVVFALELLGAFYVLAVDFVAEGDGPADEGAGRGGFFFEAGRGEGVVFGCRFGRGFGRGFDFNFVFSVFLGFVLDACFRFDLWFVLDFFLGVLSPSAAASFSADTSTSSLGTADSASFPAAPSSLTCSSTSP